MTLTLSNTASWLGSHGDGPATPIRIGLVNNMPDAALGTTEWQVRDLLSRAAGDIPVVLTVFSLPSVPRSVVGRLHVEQHHAPITELWQGGIDGLIVTGTEPRAENLTDEPYWPGLSYLIDWAEENTISTVWSCLAAHATAYALNRIQRRYLGSKLFGVFECEKVANHPLLRDTPARWCVPHSRQNELPEEELVRAGYHVLSRSPEVGADTIIKERNSLFVLFQGHPEYDSTALFGEYRRDIRRFLASARETYPDLPYGYFAAEATGALLAFRERALAKRDLSLLESFPAAAVGPQLSDPWRGSASRLYANWLGYIRERLHRRLGHRYPVIPDNFGSEQCSTVG